LYDFLGDIPYRCIISQPLAECYPPKRRGF
jgi:hypothetical protein